jgi:hypothetical protein
MRYSSKQSRKEIDAISDRHAFNRHTLHAAAKDDDVGYLLECFLSDQRDIGTGRKVTKAHLLRTLKEFNRATSFESSEAQFLYENQLVKQDTRMGEIYYETLCTEEP